MRGAANRVARGAGWIYGYRWIDRLLSFGAVVVLARILAPEDFGLVAIAASFVAILEGLSDFDVNSALIRNPDDDPALYDTAWTLSGMRGVVSALLMIAVAPFVGDQRITTVLWVLALSPLATGLSNPRFVMFERELNYSRLAVQTLSARVVSFILTVVVAIVYESYWALVAGQLANTLVGVVLSYVLRPYWPKLTLSRFSEIFAFSGWMSLTTMVMTLAMQTDRIIVGRLLGIADAGSYYMTQRVGVMPTGELVSPLRRVLFPSFSEIAHDRPKLRRVVCESIGIIGSLSLPAAIGFALIADDVVPLVLGQQWVSIVPLLVVFVPFLGFRATLSMTLPCVMALGHTRLLFKVNVVYALVHLPLFIAGTAWFGLPGAIGGIVIAGFFYSYLNAWMLRVTLGISLIEVLTFLRRPLAAVGLMVAAVFGAHALLPWDLFSDEASWRDLTVKILVGAVVFCAGQYAIWRFEGRPMGIEQRLLQVVFR